VWVEQRIIGGPHSRLQLGAIGQSRQRLELPRSPSTPSAAGFIELGVEELGMIGLDHPKRARWHLHFTPTSASSLKLIEGWFSALTRKTLRDASFTSVADLKEPIDTWASHWNDNPEPLIWTKPANRIIDKVRRGRAALDRVTNSAIERPKPNRVGVRAGQWPLVIARYACNPRELSRSSSRSGFEV
jgi:hypothetical protein